MRYTKFSELKAVPGDAYVTEAQKFLKFTKDICSSLPRKWDKYYLDPLHAPALLIRNNTRKAKRIFLDEKYLTPDQLIENLHKRYMLLDDAILAFDDFDAAFDDLMGKFDILDTDFRYFYAKVSEAVAKADPQKTLDIRIHGTDRFFSYTADINGEKAGVHFSRRKKDQLLAQERLAKERIGDRRSKDQKWLRSLIKADRENAAYPAADKAT